MSPTVERVVLILSNRQDPTHTALAGLIRDQDVARQQGPESEYAQATNRLQLALHGAYCLLSARGDAAMAKAVRTAYGAVTHEAVAGRWS